MGNRTKKRTEASQTKDWLLSPSNTPVVLNVPLMVTETMIMIEEEKINTVSQRSSSGIVPVLDAAVDESNVRSVLRSYRKYWRERPRCEGISISPVRELIRRSLSHFLPPLHADILRSESAFSKTNIALHEHPFSALYTDGRKEKKTALKRYAIIAPLVADLVRTMPATGSFFLMLPKKGLLIQTEESSIIRRIQLNDSTCTIRKTGSARFSRLPAPTVEKAVFWTMTFRSRAVT